MFLRCGALFVFVALLAFVPVVAVPTVAVEASLFRDHVRYEQQGILLDDHAFHLVGLPLVGAGGTMRDVTVVVFDAWDDAHGVLVQAIVERGFPGVRVIQYDYAAAIESCPTDTLAMFVVCAQSRFGDIFEAIIRDVNGHVVVNMSFRLFYLEGHWAKPLLEGRGCESSYRVNGDGTLRRIASLVMNSPDRIIWVAAAGNEGQKGELAFPACLSRVWAVSALEREREYDPSNLRLAGYSNWVPGEKVVASPVGGAMVYGWGEVVGTSFATPVFSAMMATWVSVCSTLPGRVEPRYFASVPGRPGAVAGVPTVLDIRC